MNISKRRGNTITFSHRGHTYEADVAACSYAAPGEKVTDEFLLTPEMTCIREQCPVCERAAKERDIADYRVTAQTCFSLRGDSEAMEMHLRFRIARGKTVDVAAQDISLRLRDSAARARLIEATEKMTRGM